MELSVILFGVNIPVGFVALIFESADEITGVTIQMQPTEQFFAGLPFTILYKILLTFESAVEQFFPMVLFVFSIYCKVKFFNVGSMWEGRG